MNQPFPWMYGNFDPIQIEIDFLKSRLFEARRSGDAAAEALILSNLRGFESLKATG